MFSANQLSIYGAVANWCCQFGLREGEETENVSIHEENSDKGLMKSVEADDVNSSVSTPRLVKASGYRSGDLKTFDDLPVHSQYSMLCDLVSWRKVKPNDFFIADQVCQTDMEESKLSAKNAHFPEVIFDPESIAKFQEGPKLDQSLK